MAGPVGLAAAETPPATCGLRTASFDIGAGLARQLVEGLDDRTLTIVALGSSSTQGQGATAPDRSYPALLARYLQERLPDLQVQVLNRGVGGEVTEAMLARLQRDVIDGGADLVLWQTGTNDAIRGVPLERFAALLQEGLARLAAADIAVVLIDPQFYPGSREVTAYPAYAAAMAKIAGSGKVGLFQRYSLMSELAQQQPEAFADLLSADRFHQSDAGYDCLARGLAEGLAAALQAR